MHSMPTYRVFQPALPVDVNGTALVRAAVARRRGVRYVAWVLNHRGIRGANPAALTPGVTLEQVA